MTWNQFRYYFDGEVERAMRYSIHEAMRRQCRQAGGGTTEGIAEDAIETFKRKMEKHAVPAIPLAGCTCGGDTGQPADHHDISCQLALTCPPRATPVMHAAETAAKVVEGWSDSKKEYADRVVSSADGGPAS